MRNNFINRIMEACLSHPELFIITGDAGMGVFDKFRDELPDRYMNLGIAEQNMIGFAAGMALMGSRPVAYNIAPFVLYRPYEQVRNDICYQNLPVILVGTGCGLVYAPQGVTHYAVEDLGLARTLPNLKVLSPADVVEARAAADYAVACKDPVYVRLATGGSPTLHQAELQELSMSQVLRPGAGNAIVCYGQVAEEAVKAWEQLSGGGQAPLVLSLPLVSHFDRKALLSRLSGIKNVICLEEHFINCGLGLSLLELKAESAAPWNLIRQGLPAEFIYDVLNCAGMREKYGLSARALVELLSGLGSGGKA
jgi:transketolase